jgi:hypothetical protein
MRRVLSAGAVVAIGVGIGAGLVVARAHPSPAAVSMAEAARALLASLEPAQLAKAAWPFTAEERVNWGFVPRERQGLPLADMTDRQREAAFALLRTGLSARGFEKAEGVRVLEGVLREMEGARRDPDRYYFTIFGEPGSATWGWRYEGHHLSQNWTIVGGTATSTTPAFIGTNPAEVRQGPHQGLRVLAAEEDLARALLAALSPEQRARAVLSDTAPPDILTGNTRRAAIEGRAGLPAEAMTPDQRRMLMHLVEEHASLQAPELAERRLARVRGESPADVLFAWMGPGDRAPGRGHYYRVQGRTFLIEYDNTQNQANHQHVVWRELGGDFGDDLLAQHYATSPHHAAHPAVRKHRELKAEN